MSLDLGVTLQQVEALAQRMQGREDDYTGRLAAVLQAMTGADASALKSKVESSRGRPFLCAGIVDGIAGRHNAQDIPSEFCVASADGSHMDVDRHMPVRCYLINVGGCLLTYGSEPDARFLNRPRLYSEEDELYLSNTTDGSRESVSVEGQLVGLKRAAEEVVGLLELVEMAPPDMPVLALLDGSLVMWGLEGRGHPPFVREEIVEKGLVPALDRLREVAVRRTLAVAAYTSLPQSREVVNALRLYLCSKDDADCRQLCSSHQSAVTPCDAVNGLLDRHVFEKLLEPGQRSDVFYSNSSISRDFYGPHWVHFYYLNTGNEIARIEVPQWVAQNERSLELSHALILDQCRRGLGYPATIAEAHEQAVLTGSDRDAFKQLLEEALTRSRVPVYTSEKNRSKRMRWL